jgi:hypothetical protein
MRWDHIDDKGNWWNIPAEQAKNGIAHEVPLPAMAQKVLAALRRFEGCTFMFTTNGEVPISGWSKILPKLREAAALEASWTLHDLPVAPLEGSMGARTALAGQSGLCGAPCARLPARRPFRTGGNRAGRLLAADPGRGGLLTPQTERAACVLLALGRDGIRALMEKGQKRRLASELDDREREYARSRHDRQDELVREFRTAAIEVSNIAIRALLLLNGGAAIALVSFVAAMVSRPEMFGEGALLLPLIAFAGGAGLAVLTSGIAYLTHSLDREAEGSYRYFWSQPYLEPTEEQDKWFRWARRLNWTGTVAAFTSLGTFFAGVGLLACAVVALASP